MNNGNLCLNRGTPENSVHEKCHLCIIFGILREDIAEYSCPEEHLFRQADSGSISDQLFIKFFSLLLLPTANQFFTVGEKL